MSVGIGCDSNENNTSNNYLCIYRLADNFLFNCSLMKSAAIL